jgi:hypothetical protein
MITLPIILFVSLLVIAIELGSIITSMYISKRR